MNRDSLRKSPLSKDKDPSTIGEDDMAKVAAEEGEIEIAKDFDVVPISDGLVWQAKAELFNTNMTACEGLVRDVYLQNPWAMCMYAEAALWRFVFERKPEDWEAALNRMRTAVAQATVLQKRYKTKLTAADAERGALYVEAVAMEANATLGISILHMIPKNFVKGAFYIRKSWKQWELSDKLLRELQATGAAVPPRIEGLVSYGVGFFFFFISLVPSHLQFLVKLLGFSGDRARAGQLLRRAMQIPESGKSVESALIVFVLLYWFDDAREDAPPILESLRAQLPLSPVMYLASGWQALMTEHNTDKALECYQKASGMTELEQLKVACRGQLAYAHFLREEWSQVKELLLSYLSDTTSVEAKSYSAFSLGLAYYMGNENVECVKWMRKCIEWEDKTSNWDAYSVVLARQYLANNDSFDRVSLLFLLVENANEAGQGERAIKYLDEIDSIKQWLNFSADDKAAMAAYFRGCALRLVGEADKAKSQLIRAAGMHGKNLALEARRAVPYALVVLGEIYLRDLNQLDNAARFFAKAGEYDKKYHFSDVLGFRLKSNNEVLEAKRKKQAPEK